MLTGGGRDDHETRNHSLDGADHGGLSEVQVVEKGPYQHAHGRTDIGIQNGDGSEVAGSVRSTPVKTVPTQPEETCAS